MNILRKLWAVEIPETQEISRLSGYEWPCEIDQSFKVISLIVSEI